MRVHTPTSLVLHLILAISSIRVSSRECVQEPAVSSAACLTGRRRPALRRLGAAVILLPLHRPRAVYTHGLSSRAGPAPAVRRLGGVPFARSSGLTMLCLLFLLLYRLLVLNMLCFSVFH
jgi:hypothetical protein